MESCGNLQTRFDFMKYFFPEIVFTSMLDIFC